MPADALNRRHAMLLDGIAAELARDGVAVCSGLLPEPLLHALHADCRAADATGALRPAAVGRGTGARQLPALRGDSTLWIEAAEGLPARGELLHRLDHLRRELNRRLLLGLQEVEVHFAAYPAGTCYVRHVDRFRDDDARVLSFTCYLNPLWQDDDGGALRLHLPDGPRDVLPRLGTCTLFLSDEIEHEVLPARQARYSLAGWFRRAPARHRRSAAAAASG